MPRTLALFQPALDTSHGSMPRIPYAPVRSLRPEAIPINPGANRSKGTIIITIVVIMDHRTTVAELSNMAKFFASHASLANCVRQD